MPKKRLDTLVLELYPYLSRTHIQSLIMQGKVTIDGKTCTKSGTQVDTSAHIEADLTEPKYVSRAGLKLEKALDDFNIDVHDLIALDAGLSTGGFTDCLLQRGIKKVYGIDVGYGQASEKIRNDKRVLVRERTNLRTMEPLEEMVDIVTLDLSFISVLKVMDVVTQNLKSGGHLVVLIKPQFEAQKHQVGRGGIIKDSEVHKEVIEKVTQGVKEHGYQLVGVIESPILGGEGNKEFLAYFTKL